MPYEEEAITPDPAAAVELPQFSLREKKMGMSHQEWLNVALAGMYRVWYEENSQGRSIGMTQLIERLGKRNRAILYKVAQNCELIDYGALGGRPVRRPVTISAGCITVEGAERVIASYRDTYSPRGTQ